MDEVPASSRILKCPFCNEHWVHKYIGSLDEYANPDDKLVAVKCGGCNAHYKNCVYGLRLQTHNSTP